MHSRSAATWNLTLATLGFAVSFAVWSLLSNLAPALQESFGLSDFEVSMLIAIPVLLGSLLRIPMGILTDRWGGRKVFSSLLLFSALPPLLIPYASGLGTLLFVGLLLGIAGSSFAVGVPYVSRWYPPEQQGFALGVFGAGNVGTAIAARIAPWLLLMGGLALPFYVFSALAIGTAVLFWVTGRDAPGPKPPILTLAARLAILKQGREIWLLSLYYFLTFGGFVAIAVYLPKYLVDMLELERLDAGNRAAGFAIMATLARPLGGWLSDRVGGRMVLNAVFTAVCVMATLIALEPGIYGLTIGFLTIAVALGLGSGAVFKLVAEVYPGQTGTASGIVGAAGGLGGFFPPLLLGAVKGLTDSYSLGFWLLGLFSAVCLTVHLLVWARRASSSAIAVHPTITPIGLQPLADRPEATWSPETVRAALWAFISAVLLTALIIIGSRNLVYFDAALAAYTFATVFAFFGIVYRYAMWLQRPPTVVYWRRTWQLFFRRHGVFRGLREFARVFWSSFIRQDFIEKRSRLRWWMHASFFWGCTLAFAVTFPLVFGWIHFESGVDQLHYRMFIFGFPTVQFAVNGIVAFLVFNALNISAVIILFGLFFAFQRRMRDRGALAVQQFANDSIPLILLFAICITGLMLTVSAALLHGSSFNFIAIAHAVSVILFLIYLPFGKFFHVFQRPASLGLALYKQAGREGPRAECVRCGEDFASLMHVEDLIEVEAAVGFDYTLSDGPDHYQRICPRCRRKLLALTQLRLQDRGGDAHG